MNTIPHMKSPTNEQVALCLHKLPCYEDVKTIVNLELMSENKVLYMGDVGCNGEIIAVIDFESEPSMQYKGLKLRALRDGHPYKSLIYKEGENISEIHFGRIYY